jgi:hypothetical protein
MRAQLSEMALDLFLENGYEQTTIDDICALVAPGPSAALRGSTAGLRVDGSGTRTPRVLRAVSS